MNNLKNINSSDSENNRKWAEISKRRLKELLTGQISSVSGKEVFEKVKKCFSKKDGVS